MARVQATAFVREFGKFQDEVREEPIEVVSHNRVTGYFVSPREFEELQQLRATVRRSVVAGQLSQSLVEALRESRMDPQHDHLNSLMD